MTIARNAWQYFVANFQPTTGLGQCGKQIPLDHHWRDSASYLAAMTAARELGIIDKAGSSTVGCWKFLATLNKLDLFRNELPNKAYNTVSGQR